MKNISGQKILVTGGAGFIGSHLVEELLKEPVKDIVIYDNFTRGNAGNLRNALKDPRVRVFDLGGDILQTDILDEAVKGCDTVVHMAALWLLHCNDFPQSAFEVNVRGSFNVMEACRRHGVKRMVYASSASVYGDAVTEPMTEDHPFNNWTFYGATKIALESMMRAYHKRYGLESAGLRYMNVYGPRQDYRGAYVAVVMKMLDLIESGEPPVVYGDGSQSYDFIHVTDAARATALAVKADTPFGVYNVGRGIKTSIKELAETLLEVTGSPMKIRYEEGGQTFVTNRVGDTATAQRDLGFMWSVDLRDGLRSLVEWRRVEKEAAEKRDIC